MKVKTTEINWFSRKMYKALRNAPRKTLHNFLDSQIMQKLFVLIYQRLYLAEISMNAKKLRQKYQIHQTVTWHPSTDMHGDGSIVIGESTYIGANSIIEAHPAGMKLEIGRFCAISHDVDIRTVTYRTDIHFRDALISSRKIASIKINDYVWIGANVFICGGVEIGENSVIGANSVVTHDVPPHSICAGVPARMIRMKPEAARMISKIDKTDLDLQEL
jgi:maltose O-acetyltransferase